MLNPVSPQVADVEHAEGAVGGTARGRRDDLLGSDATGHPLPEVVSPGEEGSRTRQRHGIFFYLVTVVLLLVANFWIPRAIPGDPLSAMQDPSARSYVANPDVRAQVAHYYALDESRVMQFRHYVEGLAHGDLGWSIEFNQPVSAMLGARIPYTLVLVLTATLIAAALAVVLGVEAGWRRGSRVDRALVTGSVVMQNVPVYLVATLLLILLSVKLDLFPIGGAGEPFADLALPGRIVDGARHLALPVLTLVLDMVGGGFLLVRNSMVTVLGADFMGTTLATGLPERTRRYRYAMRNAVLPFFTLLSLQVALAVSGAVFVETVFAYPGVGLMMFEAVRVRDYPVLQGGFLVIGIWVLVVNALADLALRWLDPRVRSRA
ncbi:MAG: ABC transporter permease [Candidatus Dormibacteria bacterium]